MFSRSYIIQKYLLAGDWVQNSYSRYCITQKYLVAGELGLRPIHARIFLFKRMFSRSYIIQKYLLAGDWVQNSCSRYCITQKYLVAGELDIRPIHARIVLFKRMFSRFI